MKKILFILLLFLASNTAFCQVLVHKTINLPKRPKGGQVVYGKVIDGDTLLIVNLPEIDISLMQKYFDACGTRKGARLIHNVKKAYPYAKKAGDKLKEYDSLLAATDSEKERKQLMKQAEDEIVAQYGKELENLTSTQGRILIRLIDRETGNNSYTLVKELRGKVRAAFYQGFARLWGFNLKTDYDPVNNEEDELIEIVITLIDRGII